MQNWWLEEIALLHTRSILNSILIMLWITIKDGKLEQVSIDPQTHLFLLILLVSSNIYCANWDTSFSLRFNSLFIFNKEKDYNLVTSPLHQKVVIWDERENWFCEASCEFIKRGIVDRGSFHIRGVCSSVLCTGLAVIMDCHRESHIRTGG